VSIYDIDYTTWGKMFNANALADVDKHNALETPEPMDMGNR
jgi:hypothetical protein